MSLEMTRRNVLTGGCALLGLLALPTVAEASVLGSVRAAPRRECPHEYCRHHRKNGEGTGICGMSLHAPLIPTPENAP